MSKQRKLREKIVASILVFCLMVTNMAGLGITLVAYASDNQSSAGENIAFSAGITTTDVEKQTAYVADVTDENLSIVVNVGASGSGYLKSPVLEIEDLENQIFEIKGEFETGEVIQNVDGNKIYLNQISGGVELEINIPIQFKETEEGIDVSKLSSTINIKLSGTYVDEEGNSEEVEGIQSIELGWKSDTSLSISSSVEKYVPYKQDGVEYALVQLKIEAGLEEGTTSLPIKDTNINLTVPQIEGATLNSVGVSAINTALTNGLEGNDVVFTTDNWTYSTEENKVVIQTSNILNEETNTYVSPSGSDEYVVTLIYSNAENIEENAVLTGTLAISENVYSADGSKNISGENETQYDLSEQTGSIVTCSVTGQTETVSKGNMYANYNLSDNYYETEYSNLLSINVSRPSVVQIIEIREDEEYFTDKEGNKIQTSEDDNYETYYKSLTMSKENLETILGENGSIDILDTDNNVLLSVTKESIKDIDGDVELNFGSTQIGKIIIQIKNPEAEGILNIVAKKAIGKLSYSKTKAISLASLTNKYIAKAKYDGEVITDLDDMKTEVTFEETVSSANISLNRDELSTLVTNEDVEISISLNNYNDTTDLYKNPVFELTFPEAVSKITVKTMNVLYGNEELTVDKIESYKDDAGQIVLRVTVAGTQTQYSMVDAASGTTIILNTDIELDKYITSSTKALKMNYYNESATAYESEVEWVMEAEKTESTLLETCGEANAVLKIVAPEGVIISEEISGYAEDADSIYSIKQGEVSGTIATYTDARTATMIITMMNNTEDTMKDVSILGRTAFAGNKSITTEEELGTTIDSSMLGALEEIANANKDIKIYYSENPVATKDLTNEENGWKESMETYTNIKSYLIVVDGEVAPEEVISYSYEYEIPAQLSANNAIISTVATYYKVNDTEYVVEANKVALKTVEEPVLVAETTSDAGDDIKEGQIITYTVTVRNEGKAEATDIAVTSKIEEGTTYLEKQEDGTYILRDDVTELKLEIGTIEAGTAKEVSYKVQVDENATEELPESDSIEEPDQTLSSTSVVEAEGLETPIYTQSKETVVKEAEFNLTLSEENYVTAIKEGKELTFHLLVEASTTVKNPVITIKLPAGVSFKDAYRYSFLEDGISTEKIECAEYDKSTRTVTYTFDRLAGSVYVELEVTIDAVATNDEEISFMATATADNVDEYESNEIIHKLSKPTVSVAYESTSSNKYIKEGSSVEYVLTVTNTSSASADNITFSTAIPDGLNINSAVYQYNSGDKSQMLIKSDGTVSTTFSIMAGDTATITLSGKAASLSNGKETKVSSVWNLTSDEIGTVTSDKITQVVQAKTKATTTDTSTSSNKKVVVSTNNTSNNVGTSTSKYKISGMAWNDKDEDGCKDSSESGLSGVIAKLYNASTNKQVSKTTTDSSGEYVFSGVESGSYYIIFAYNTSKYKLTTYHADGVNSSSNSDVILTNSLAITDKITVSDSSSGDIDIGLVESKMFDLSLSKTVTKVTVQNDAGTTAYNFDNVSTAKVDIKAKQMASSKVYVEYEITVYNKGELKGYAKSIIDYIPEGLSFSQDLNSNNGWYQDSDGNLYNTTLENTALESGQKVTVNLVLVKQMTTESTGVFTNSAEIVSAYNEAAISDTDSTPGNGVTNEDDFGSADLIISVNTGGGMVNVMILITTLITLFVALWVIKLGVDRKNKGVITWED